MRREVPAQRVRRESRPADDGRLWADEAGGGEPHGETAQSEGGVFGSLGGECESERRSECESVSRERDAGGECEKGE